MQSKVKKNLTPLLFRWPSIGIIGIMIIFLLFSGCKKFIDVGPPTTLLTAESIYANDATAIGVMSGVYLNMINSSGIAAGNGCFGYVTGLEGDELKNYGTDQLNQQYYQNELTPANPYFWQEIYTKIHVCNAVIDGVNSSNTITTATRTRLIGEAKFMRAFLHYYAVINYGDVPLVNTSDYTVNKKLSRSPAKDVLQFVVKDLQDAQANLPSDYIDPAGNLTSLKVRPNKATATALLARVDLYTGNYNDAITQSTSLINNDRFKLEGLNDVFLKTSREAIWQLQAASPGSATFDGRYFVLTSAPGVSLAQTALSPQMVQAFMAGDQRFVDWVGRYHDGINTYYFPYKYKDGQYISTRTPDQVNEFTTVFRLAEQYLIRAEANIQLNKIDEGIADINIIRTRSRMAASSAVPNPLPDYPTGLSQDAALTALIKERQVELFTEWGHRWYDLQRLGKLDDVMQIVAPLKYVNWKSYKALMPIPQSEINSDPNLKQNPGYN